MTKIKSLKPNVVAAFFLVLAAIAYFVGLGALPLVGPDEPRYAQVAREMYLRNDWITPTLGGFDWFEKPALTYWLMIVTYKLFGVSEFSARAGSALFGLLTTLTLFWLAKFVTAKSEKPNFVADDKQPAISDLAFWTLIVSASSIGLLIFSYAATFDIILTFPITAALVCFFAFEISNSKAQTQNLKFLIGFYLFVGLALLAKGLVGVVLPFGIVFWYFVLTRKLPSKTFLASLIWGTFVSLGVASTWYAPMYLRHGWTFIDEFFLQHHFARYTSNKYAHPEPFWFFWVILPALTLPWLPFFLAALWRFFKAPYLTFKRINSANYLFDKLRVFALCWLFVPLFFFSFSGSKLPGYILPALPAALILIAQEVWQFAEKNQKRALALKLLAVIVLVGVPLSLFSFGSAIADRDSTKKLLSQAIESYGYADEKVLCLHDVSHSLEFYAAGRLVRLPNGWQRKFEGVGEIFEFMSESGVPRVLILVPLEHEHQLLESNLIAAQKIADNGAFALVAATKK